MSITSYAQNFEDVMLWRALGHVKEGRYIDIGAQDPVIDSVSLAFYEHGWRGIHVEPTPHYANLLRKSRPEDTVIQAAIGSKKGVLTFFECPETGLSTADRNIAKQHRKADFQIREITVPCMTLADVFSQCTERDVHWLKIDVEGYERHVLKSWRTASIRPWIVVVESTLPNTQIESHRKWERLVLDRGYRFAYFDGLNRFYVSEAHPELLDSFRVPPNFFDEFTLNVSSPFCVSLSSRIHALEERGRQDKEVSQQEALRLSQALAEREQQLGAQLQASQQEALRLSQALAEREQALGTQLQASQQEALRLSNALAEREQALGAQLQTSQQEALRLSQALSDTRSEGGALRQKLVVAQQQAADITAELAASQAKVEELNQSSHHWWMVADGLNRQLKALYASRSWRITAPLRRVNAALHTAGQLPHTAKDKSKRGLKLLLAHGALYIKARPRLKQGVLAALALFPALKARLFRVAEVNSLPAPIPATPTQVPASADQLSPRARQVYQDLMQVKAHHESRQTQN